MPRQGSFCELADGLFRLLRGAQQRWCCSLGVNLAAASEMADQQKHFDHAAWTSGLRLWGVGAENVNC